MNNELKEILDRNWQRSSTRKMTFQKSRLYYDGLYHDFYRLFGCRQRFMLVRIVDGIVKQYLDEKESGQLASYLHEQFINQKNAQRYFKKLSKELKNRFDYGLKSARSFDKNWKQFSNVELIKALEDFYFLDNKFGAFHWVLFNNVEEILVGVIENLMQKEKIGKQIVGNLSLLARPTLITPIDMERTSILNCALNDKADEKLIKEHVRAFASFPMVDINYEPYSKEYFQKECDKLKNEFAKKLILNELNKIKNKYEIQRKENEIYLKLFDNNKKIRSVLEFYQTFANYKDRKPYVRDQISYNVRGLFKEVSERLGITLDHSLFMTERELSECLTDKTKISKVELDARIKNSAYVFHDGVVDIVINKNDLKMVDDYLLEKQQKQELKGTPVSPGVVKGKVVIILSNSDFGKFKKGDILVSSATRPDFVPLMKQAAAIITDEGGLLSHAAIISRELKTPCVVGTKNATEILKDGNVVVVDANRGIILLPKRIIPKRK